MPSVFVSAASGRTLARAVAEATQRRLSCASHPARWTAKTSLAASAFAACVAAAAVLSLVLAHAAPLTVARRARADAAGASSSGSVSNRAPRGTASRAWRRWRRARERARTWCFRRARMKRRNPRRRHGTARTTCARCAWDEHDEGDEIRELECEHAFHKTCIDEWLTTKRAFCPCCKHSIVPRGAAERGRAGVGGSGAAPGAGVRRRHRRGRGAPTVPRARRAGTGRGRGRDAVAGAPRDVFASGRTSPDEEEARDDATVPLRGEWGRPRGRVKIERQRRVRLGGPFMRPEPRETEDDENENENENETPKTTAAACRQWRRWGGGRRDRGVRLCVSSRREGDAENARAAMLAIVFCVVKRSQSERQAQTARSPRSVTTDRPDVFFFFFCHAGAPVGARKRLRRHFAPVLRDGPSANA